MAVTQTFANILNAVTTTQTSSAFDVSADYVDTLFVIVAVVGTATTAAQIVVQESPDATNYYNPPTKVWNAGLAAGSYWALIPIDPTTNKIKVTFIQQAGGTSSTCTAQLGRITAL